MTFRDQIIKAYPIADYITKAGRTLDAKGKCKCFFHGPDKTPSFSVDVDKGLWFCFPCDIGGSVIDLHMRLKHLSCKEAMKDLAEAANISTDLNLKTTYEYRNAYGKPVMYVDRMDKTVEKKTFSQYKKDEKGTSIFNVDGVQRVLFQVDKWISKEEVCLCEGEKCVQALELLGFDATTNVGGSNGWLDAYVEDLKDKHLDIYPDNDDPGGKWLDAVLKSCEGKVASLRIIRLPKPYNDIADVVIAQGKDQAFTFLANILEKTSRIERGVSIPIMSMAEAYDKYRTQINTINERGIDMGKWIPSLSQCTRILLPGDMVVLLSDTGVGKTTMLGSLAYSQAPLPVLFFELELSGEALSERFLAKSNNMTTLEVEKATKDGKRLSVEGAKHIYLCDESKLTLEKIEEYILRSELKIQSKPALVLIDYIGLMSGSGGKRYEKLSTIAEGLKTLARSTGTVVVVASQIHRKDPTESEVNLHDAKDSGSIENSAQLVLGAWRPAVDRITIKVLKCTKNAGTHEINCLFDGGKQTIKELAD